MPIPTWIPGAEAFPKKSILTPIGALTFGIAGICVLGAVRAWPSPLSWALLAILLAPLGVSLWAYVFFAIRDPDRLQTEDYRIQREYVARIGGPDGMKTISGDGAKLIANPGISEDQAK
jgi:hypothetical protein